MHAIRQFFIARDLAAGCNAAQASAQEKTSRQSGPNPEGSFVARESQDKWSITQGYCVLMGGLAFQTNDGWLYTIPGLNTEDFVRAGLVHSSQFQDDDVKDRSKSDALGKAFTVLQSVSVTCNIIARAVSLLPICPLELATLAYVFCGFSIYAFWWFKPNDMTTQAIIPLPTRFATLAFMLACFAGSSGEFIHHN